MTKTSIEYEEAPSGMIYFYNYKTPLMPFEGGYGYIGSVVHDETSNQIQCHFCGGWFDILGHHLHKEHNMTASEYKKAVGLNKGTALISETHRALLIAKGLKKRIKNLRPNKSHTIQTRKKISATLKENRAEMQNINNTCPEQLLERLVKHHQELGRSPLMSTTGNRSEIPFRSALVKVYGSMKNAYKLAGIPYRKPGENRDYEGRRKWTKDVLILKTAEFYKEHGRFPKVKEIGSGKNYFSKFGGYKNIYKKALIIAKEGEYTKLPFRVNHTPQELLNFLRMFKKINGRYPAVSDCKRGLLPYASRYIYHWKSWNTALKVAFPEYTRPSQKKEINNVS